MFELLLIGCYGLIGFGIGGISFKNHHKNKIESEYGKLKKEIENELNQQRSIKGKYETKNLELIKNSTELQKSYNRSKQNVEILQTELQQIKVLIEQIQKEKKVNIVGKTESNIDSYFD